MKAKYIMRNFHLSNQKRKELYKNNKLINREQEKRKHLGNSGFDRRTILKLILTL